MPFDSHPVLAKPGIDTLTAIVLDHPFTPRQIDYVLPLGMSIAEMLNAIQIDPYFRDYCVVRIDGDPYPVRKEIWHVVRPKRNVVIIPIVTTGGGFRIAAQIGIAVLAVTAVALTGGALGPVGAALLGAGIGFGGQFAITTFFPPEQPKQVGQRKEDPIAVITGGRNSSGLGRVIPFVLGKFRYAPYWCAQPYREIIGGEVYWRVIYANGHGPLFRDPAKTYIGETLISNFSNVEIQDIRGYWSLTNRGSWNPGTGAYPSATPAFADTWTVSTAGTYQGRTYKVGDTITFNNLGLPSTIGSWDLNQNQQFSLYPNDVFSEDLAVTITMSGGPEIRTTQTAADQIAVEWVFQNGLVFFENDPPGKKHDHVVVVKVEQRTAGAGSWATVTTKTIRSRRTTPLYGGHQWTPTQLQTANANRDWDVRLTYVSGEKPNDDRYRTDFTWISLRTYTTTGRAVIPLDEGICYTALRIKATGQIQGVVDEFRAEFQTIAQDYVNESWHWRLTSNPAALLRFMSQHPAAYATATDSQLSLPKFEEFAVWCRENGYEFNSVLTEESTLFDKLSLVAKAGRATIDYGDLILSLAIDKPKTVPLQMFTTANSDNYQGRISFAPIPHALRIPFVSASKGYEADELVVYDDGYSATNATDIERKDQLGIGIVSREQIYNAGRKELADLRLRFESHSIDVDFEHFASRRGDLVALQHSIIAVGLISGRIQEIIDDGTNVIAVRLDQKVEQAFGRDYAFRARRVVGNAFVTDLYEIQASTQVAPEPILYSNNEPIVYNGEPIVYNVPQPFELLYLKSPVPIEQLALDQMVAVGELGKETIRVLLRDIEPHQDLGARLTFISEAPAVHTAHVAPIPPPDSGVTRPTSLSAPIILSVKADRQIQPGSREVLTRLIFSLSQSEVADARPVILYRLTGTDMEFEETARLEWAAKTATIIGLAAGETYDFRLQYVHPNYLASPVTQLNAFELSADILAAPLPLTGLDLAILGNQVRITWDPILDEAVRSSADIVFRHSPVLTMVPLWENAISIGSVSANQSAAFLSYMPGTYLAKVVDSAGRASEAAAISTLYHDSVLPFTTFSEIYYHPNFDGEKVDCLVSSGRLQLSSIGFDDVSDISAITDWDAIGGAAVTADGIYRPNTGMDFGSIRKLRLRRHLLMESVNLTELWDSDEILDGDDLAFGSRSDKVGTYVQARFTNDDPNNVNANWSEFFKLESKEINARAVGHIELYIFTTDNDFSPQIVEFGLIAEELV